MASYEALVFSERELFYKVLEMCDAALDDAIDVILSNEYFRNGMITVVPKDGYEMYKEVEASDLKAWVVEYGQGAEAEFWRNPYWQEYVNSGLTSRYRLTDARIRQRGYKRQGNPTVIFEENRVGSITGGNPEGRLLDDESQEAYSVKAEPFLEDLLHEAYIAFSDSFYARTSNFDITTCFVKSRFNV